MSVNGVKPLQIKCEPQKLNKRHWSLHCRPTWHANYTISCIPMVAEAQKVTILTCKCASRHGGVPVFPDRNIQNSSRAEVFCIFWLANVLCATAACHFSLLNSYLRTRCFSEPTFRTSGTPNHWKNTAIRDIPNIWRVCIFFLVTLLACWSSFCWLDFSTLLFNCPYCRKLDF